MIAKDEAGIRDHEERALELYLATGREDDPIRARQALVLAVFLAGDHPTALQLEEENLEAFRRTGSQYEIADSTTLLSAILFSAGDPMFGIRAAARPMSASATRR
jgi:hypothetical protein